ncbi:MAG: Tim44 domain-containing protein [Betaproteobacteria bacterium]
MNRLITLLVALVTLSVFALDADARRLGGGKTLGKQRESLSQQQAAPKAPAQQQQQAAAGSTTPAQQPTGASRWLGPLAGLALGAGLAALFLNNGIAGLLAGVLLLGLIVAAVYYAARMIRGRTASAPMQYAGARAGAGGETPRIEPMLAGGAAAHSVAATTSSRWPANFDAAEFLRHAKLNFVRLQATHDQKDISTLRDYLTPDLYREIEADMRDAGGAQTTEVVTLNADILDVATEDNLYVVSVRFSGLIREAAGEDAQPFSEVWHLEKPVSGRSGWLVAGIQQG